MRFGFSGEAFENSIWLILLAALFAIPAVFFIARRWGSDTATHRFQIRVFIICLIIFITIPFWLSDLTVRGKILITILSLAAGIGNYVAFERMQRTLREKDRE